MGRKDHSDFDGIVRRKLNNLDPAYRPESWEMLSRRLDAADQLDAFDQEVSQELKRVSVPFSEQSWKALAARLELEQQRLQSVLHYKAMELSILLLLFLVVWQHFPTTVHRPAVPAHPQIPIASIAPENSTVAQAEASEEANNQHQDIALVNQSQSQDLLTATNSLDLNEPTAASSSQVSFEQDLPLAKATKRVPQSEAPNLPTVDFAHVNSEYGPTQQIRELNAERTEAFTSPSDPFLSEGALASLENQSPALLDYGEAEELLDYIRPMERKTFFRVGFVGSPDYLRVITPPTTIDNDSVVSLDRYSLGYSGGITLGIERGRFEIETGAIYSARRYRSIPTVYITGSIKEGGFQGVSLRDFELNTVSFPLNFRHNFILHDKWRMYALGGASLNLVLQANYYAVDQEAFASLESRFMEPSQELSTEDRLEPLKEKSLTAGWLDGGSFWDNTTFYGNLGIGLERYVTNNWSVYAQPTYQHAFHIFNQGLGPYKDRIHAFSINMGLKVRL